MAVDRRTSLLVLLLMAFLPLAFSGRYLVVSRAHSHETLMKGPWFKYGDPIPLFANKVNRLEKTCMQYPYFDYPFCPPGEKRVSKKKSLAEVLAGDCFTNTQYKLKFKVSSLQNVLCEKTLTRKEVRKFREAVRDSFEYQMSYNNIFFRGMVGKIDEKIPSDPRYYLVRNINFYPQYYHNQVRAIDVVDDFDSAVDITEDDEIKVNFTYSVLWKEYKPQKLDNSSLQDSQPAQDNGIWKIASLVHFWASNFLIWFGVLFVVIVPYWRSYLKRANRRVESIVIDELRNFQINARPSPPFYSLLGAILGTGTQLLLMIILFFLTYYAALYPHCPRTLYLYILWAYCLFSPVSGYKATAFHLSFSQVNWKESIFLAVSVYFVPASLTVLVANILAERDFGTSDLTEFSDNLEYLLIGGMCTVAFLIAGSKLAHWNRQRISFVTNAARVPRGVPHWQPWYLKTLTQMFIGGSVPFVFLFGKMDDLYASLWNQKICGGFETMLILFLSAVAWILAGSIFFTYFHLTRKDSRWWWSSVLRGGSLAIFVFIYGIYFFIKTGVEDANLLLYLGYSACIFYALFLIFGTISFYASSFLRRKLPMILPKSE